MGTVNLGLKVATVAYGMAGMVAVLVYMGTGSELAYTIGRFTFTFGGVFG